MKIVLDIKGVPSKNDIIIFDGKDFKCINKELFLQECINEDSFLLDRTNQLLERINKLEKEVKILKGEE